MESFIRDGHNYDGQLIPTNPETTKFVA